MTPVVNLGNLVSCYPLQVNVKVLLSRLILSPCLRSSPQLIPPGLSSFALSPDPVCPGMGRSVAEKLQPLIRVFGLPSILLGPVEVVFVVVFAMVGKLLKLVITPSKPLVRLVSNPS